MHVPDEFTATLNKLFSLSICTLLSQKGTRRPFLDIITGTSLAVKRLEISVNATSHNLGLKRKFSFSHFRENFRKNFLKKFDQNSENFCENFRDYAKSIIFTTYFNSLRTFLSIILF
jgi:hypothetical protein